MLGVHVRSHCQDCHPPATCDVFVVHSRCSPPAASPRPAVPMSLPSPTSTDDPDAFTHPPGVGATSSPQPDPPQPLNPLPSPTHPPADHPSLPPDPVTPHRPDEQGAATPPSTSASLQHAQPPMNFDSPATPKPRKPHRNSSRPRPRRIVEDKDPLIRHTLQIEASNLPISDQSHRPAPFVALFCRIDDDDDDSDLSPGEGGETGEARADNWEFVGVTETADTVNPRWLGMFTIDSRRSENPVLRFVIYNNRKPSSSASSSSATPTPSSLASKNIPGGDLSKHEYIGEISHTITQIVLNNNKLVVEPVIKNPNNTTKSTSLKPFSSISTSSKSVSKQNISLLTVRAEEQKGDLGETVTFVFSISLLPATHIRLKTGRKPFFLLSRKNRNDEEFGTVVQSEVHERYNRSDTTFQPVTESIARLVNNDHDRLLRIEFFDYNRNGHSHSRIGSTTFTLRSIRNQLESSNCTASYTLQKQRSATGMNHDVGSLNIKKCSLDIPYTFKDYLDAGVSIRTVIAIDMSNTNGDPQSPSSFHYNNPKMPNEYVVALREVGRVLADYSTSKEFPAFGFGAVLPPNKSETSDCFALTGNYNDPACSGIDDVIVQYYNALNQVGPYEPCRYGPVLDHVIRMTRDANSGDASAYDAWVGGGFDGWVSESNSFISKKSTVETKQTNDHLESNNDIPASIDDEDKEYEPGYDTELSLYNDKDPTSHESSDLPTTNTNLDTASDSTGDNDDESFDGKGPGPVYTILLIVTDGDFADFDDVSNLVCQAADLPLSIVIVGVGNSDFVKLERLDGDRDRLCSPDGTPCSRDIVQFVRFHAHRYNPSQLAREVLEELPDQLVAYMRSQSIKPEDIDPPPLSNDHDRLGSRRPAPYFPNQNPSVSSNIPSSSSPPSSLAHISPIAATPALNVAAAPSASSSQLLLHTPQLQPHPSVQPQQSVQTQQQQVLATPQQQPLQHIPHSQPVQPQLQHSLQPAQQPQPAQMPLQNPLLSTSSLMPQQPGYGLMPPQTQVHPHAPYQSNQNFPNLLGASGTGYFPQQQMVYSSVGFPMQQAPITTMPQQHNAQQQSQHFQNTNWISVQSVQQYPHMFINSLQQQQQQQPQPSQQPSFIGQPQLTTNGMYPPNLTATQQQQQQQQQNQLQPPGAVPSSTPWQHQYPSHGHRA